MADFNFYLNRQGPKGEKGEQGEKGDNGVTPTFYAGTDTDTTYTLIIDSGNGNTFETSNLKVPTTNAGGTYLRYDQITGEQSYAPADIANLQGDIGEVKLATTTSVANETVQDSDAVSYELFRQGGGGGGTSFIPGTGLELTNANVLNVKIDNDTITTNPSGQLVANGGGGGTTYTAGNAIDLTGNAISVKTDGTSIGLNASNELELKAIIPDAQVQSDWSQEDNTKVDYIKNKPTIGAGVITFTQGSTVLGTIDVNQTTATTINIPSSGGGGGGSTYAAGNGIEISNADVISAKVDGTTIGFSASGELELKATIPTDTSDLTNGAGYITSSALSGYATQTWVGNQGYLTGITSGDVTTALGYTPYSSANPDGYTTNVGTVTSVNNSNPDSDGNVTISIPDITNMVTTNTSQTISGTKTFSTETHFTGNLTFDSALGTPIIRGMSGANYRNMITRSNTYSKITTGNTSDNLILKGALTRPQYSHDSSDGGYLALYSDIPTVNDSTISFTINGVSAGSITTNQASGSTIALTDTQYSVMTGASAGIAGVSGLVPQPSAGDEGKFLRGDGTWQTISSGGSTDVQINGSSITNNGTANIVTEGVYNSSTNKIATVSDIPTDYISTSAPQTPLEVTTTTAGVQKFNYTGNTGTVNYKSMYGFDQNPSSSTFQYISELPNGLNFITTCYICPSGNSYNLNQTAINLGTYNNGIFTTLLSFNISNNNDYFNLYDGDIDYNYNLKANWNGTYYYIDRTSYASYESNDKNLVLFSYDSSLDKIKVGLCYPSNDSGGWITEYATCNNVSLQGEGGSYTTKLAQCTHIQVAFENNVASGTQNIEDMVLTNPSTSYINEDLSVDGTVYTLSQASTNLYTSTITNQNLVLNYDSTTLGVNGSNNLYAKLPTTFTGTDGNTAGTTGLVPAPTISDTDKYLKSDGTWATINTGANYTATTPITITSNDIALTIDSNTLELNSSDALAVKTSAFVTQASLQTVHCVIDTYSSGTFGYREWDDGLIEYFGANDVGANSPITLNLPYDVDTTKPHTILANSQGQYPVTVNTYINPSGNSITINLRNNSGTSYSNTKYSVYCAYYKATS